jgi:hypothetical protein
MSAACFSRFGQQAVPLLLVHLFLGISLFFLLSFTSFSVTLHSQAAAQLLDCLANASAFLKASFMFPPHSRLSHNVIWALQLYYQSLDITYNLGVQLVPWLSVLTY